MTVTAQRSLAMFLYDGVASSDVTGPLECFGLANFISGRTLYEIFTFSADGRAVKAAGGWLSLQPVHSFASLAPHIDILLMPGGPASAAIAASEELQQWLRGRAGPATRMGSICNGTFILAAAGLARGARVATHWMYAEQLAQLYPDMDVDADALFVHADNLWTSAGMTAGMDLALAMIEEDCGRTLAMEVARHMVLYMRRAGGQSQFSMHLKAQFSDVPAIGGIQQWIIDNPAADLRIATLAGRAGMTERTLLRLFRKHAGMTLGTFVTDARVRHACNLLETNEQEMKSVAALCGLGTEGNMRKVFMARLGIPPTQYRARFKAGLETGNGAEKRHHFSYDETWLHRTEVREFKRKTAGEPQGSKRTDRG